MVRGEAWAVVIPSYHVFELRPDHATRFEFVSIAIAA